MNQYEKQLWDYRFQYVKRQIDGLEYMQRHMRLKSLNNHILRGRCIFHNEKTPSFTVYNTGYSVKGVVQEYTSFHCFGCKASGDIISFKQRLEGVTRQEACELLEKEFNINVKDENVKTVLIKESLENIRKVNNNFLTFSQINMICSGICRNYLDYIFKNKKEVFEQEFNYIDQYYLSLDDKILDMNALEAILLIDITKEEIKRRKKEIGR